MNFAEQVFLVLGHALNSAQLSYTPDPSMGHVTSVTPTSDAQSMFEYLTMHSAPEIRAQEALLPYLVAAGFHVTRECRMHVDGKRRNFDFVVRPSASHGGGPGFGPNTYVIVELKHLGAHQTGGFAGLLGPVVGKAGALSTLHNDFSKPRPPVPLIQLGLYTVVTNWGPASSPVHWTKVDSPFVQNHVKGKTLPTNYFAQVNSALSTWVLNNSYTRPASWPVGSHFNFGPTVSYVTPAGVKLSGRVDFFLGITT